MKKKEIRKRRRRQKAKERLKQKLRQKPKLHFPKEKIKINKNRIRKSILLVLEIGLACLLAYSLVLFYGQRVSNAGDSMNPVLKNGDVVLVDRLVYNAVTPKRGDIIVFKPDGNENAHYMIKRVAALPGETIQIKNGSIYIDGEVCRSDIYVSDITSAGLASEPVELGSNEYFVIGDNHEGSDDSRTSDVGNVSRKDIFGKAWFVVSPRENFGRIKN